MTMETMTCPEQTGILINKFLAVTSMLISICILSSYDLNRRHKNQYVSCIKKINNNCKIHFKYQVKSLIRTCKLLVTHNHNIDQIKNASACIRKKRE